MKRRILYHHRIRADDGQAVHVRELIGALRAEGHEVLEVALVPKATAPEATAGAGQPPRGGWLQHLRLPRSVSEGLEVAYDIQGVRMVLRAARAFRPDMIYERHALHCATGLRAARRLGIPLLLEVNSPMCDEMERLGMLRFARLARRTERAVLAGADAVLPVSEVLREMLIDLGARPERSHVIHNGAVPDRYDAAARSAGAARRARWPDEAFVLGFVGYVRPWHRLDLALEAMATPALAPVHLAIAGQGPALADLLLRAAELGVGDRVHPEGTVAPAELPAWLCGCDATLIPAINDYASPLKLFDALAAGVATLAPDQPNLREIIVDGDNGVLFRPGDAGSLAEALGRLVGDRGRTAAIGTAARRSLLRDDRTWRGNARRVIEIFEGMVETGHRVGAGGTR